MAQSKLSLNLSPELKEWLKRQAEYAGCSEAALATRALEKFREAKNRLIRDAMAEADRGVFVSEEKMTAWVLSWDTENELPLPEPDVFLNGA